MSNSVVEFYDKQFFTGKQLSADKLGFFNVGYWNDATKSLEQAQVNLIEILASFFSERSGNILDVACGKGASTKFLTRFFSPSAILGINISEKQLEVCRVIAPDCHFRLMKAEKLEFEEAAFDNVLCLEAAFHFETRTDFLKEAYRVLKPAGRLAMSDFIGGNMNDPSIPNVESYQELLLKIGFRHARVEDSTEFQGKAFLNHEIKRLEDEFGRNKNQSLLEEITQRRADWAGAITCMVYAIK